MEELKSRTVDDIQKEYTALCARAGHLQYQIKALSDDLVLVNESLKTLNIEASSVAKSSAEAKKEESNA